MSENLAVTDPGITIVVGLLLPYLLAILNQKRMPPRLMAAAALVASVVASVAVTFLTGHYDHGNNSGTLLLILSVSQLFYRTLGQHLGLPELEEMTQIRQRTGPDEGATPAS